MFGLRDEPLRRGPPFDFPFVFNLFGLEVFFGLLVVVGLWVVVGLIVVFRPGVVVFALLGAVSRFMQLVLTIP